MAMTDSLTAMRQHMRLLLRQIETYHYASEVCTCCRFVRPYERAHEAIASGLGQRVSSAVVREPEIHLLGVQAVEPHGQCIFSNVANVRLPSHVGSKRFNTRIPGTVEIIRHESEPI